MKALSFFVIFIGVTCISTVIAQPACTVKYQAVARDAEDNVYSERQIGVQFSVLQGAADGPAVYVEQHSTSTSTLGLFNLELGSGTVVLGNWLAINWLIDEYFLQVDLDLDGGQNYETVGVSPILAVPISIASKYAAVAGNIMRDTLIIKQVQSDTIIIGFGIIDTLLVGKLFAQDACIDTVKIIDSTGMVTGFIYNQEGKGSIASFDSLYADTAQVGKLFAREVCANTFNIVDSTGDITGNMYDNGHGESIVEVNRLIADIISADKIIAACYDTIRTRKIHVSGLLDLNPFAEQMLVTGDVTMERPYLVRIQAMNGESNTAAAYLYNPNGSAGSRNEGSSFGSVNQGNSGTVGQAFTAPGSNSAGAWGTVENEPDMGQFSYATFGNANGGVSDNGVYAGMFFGDVCFTGELLQASDRRLKTDIDDIKPVLSKIRSLRPKKYRMNNAVQRPTNDSRLHYGFIAQDVEPLFPDLVSVIHLPDDTSPENMRHAHVEKYKSLNYEGFVPVLTQGMQELADIVDAQQETIDAQNSTIDAMQLVISRLESRIEALENE